jgi:branched-subunit amino acid transport protein
MTDAWILVLAVGLATVGLKAAGPLVLGGRQLPAPALGVIGLMAPALLAALIATNTLASGQQLVLDARLLGVVAAGAAILLRAPLIVVVAVAAIVTAAARAAGIA